MNKLLVVTLRDENNSLVRECEIPLKRFPDMIEMEKRQFFRIGVTGERGSTGK